MTCKCGQFLRKFLRAGVWVRVCPKCQPFGRRATTTTTKKHGPVIPISELLMYRAQGMTYSEIANITGLNYSNVKVRLAYARKHAA